MYGHSYYGTQKRPAASQEEDNRNEGRAPRQHEVDVVGDLSRDQEREGNFREPEQHYYATSSSDMQLSSPPSTNMSADSPSPDQTGRSSPGRTPVDRLVKKLSKHNLQLGSRSRVQSQPPPQPQIQPQPFHQPGSSSTYSSAPWPKIEIETQPGQSCLTGPYGRLTSWGPPPILDAGEPIEVDDEEQEEALDIKKLNFRRIRRQPSGLGMRHSAGSTSRSAESRLEQMIANETQCRVRKDPLSSKASSTSFQPAAIIAAEPVTIEVDPEFALPNWDTTLEVDPAYLNNNDELNADESVSLEDPRLALRDAAGPSGIRKYSAGGVQLRYRLSVDAALRCQNVVRSRPRMRKRDKSRFSSAASSAVTSTVSSPVIAPTRLPPS